MTATHIWPRCRAAMIAAVVVLLTGCESSGNTLSEADASIAEAGRGDKRVAILELHRLDPGINDWEPFWPIQLRPHAAQQDVVRLVLRRGNADVMALRVLDSETGTELTPNLAMRWIAPDELLLARIGSAFPDRLDLELDLVRYDDTEAATMNTRPMSTAEVPRGTVRMQSVINGLAQYEKEGRSFARLVNTMPAPGWSTIYVQWTSNRRSPALTPVIISTDGERYVVTEVRRFSTLDPIGIFEAPLSARELDHIEWREYAGTHRVRLRGIELPLRESPVEADTRFAIPFRPPGGPTHTQDFGTFSIIMEQHHSDSRMMRMGPGGMLQQPAETEVIVIVRGYGGAVRLATDPPHRMENTATTASRRHRFAVANGLLASEPGVPTLYLDFGTTE